MNVVIKDLPEDIKRKIYISGPMTGYENFNKAEFHKAEKKLINEGYQVLNPASLPEGLEYNDYIDIAKVLINRCDALYLLKGWENSKGAILELQHYLSISKKPYFVIESENDLNIIAEKKNEILH